MPATTPQTGTPPAPDHEGGLTDPDQILLVLLGLARQGASLRLRPAGMHPIATRLLLAEPASRACILEWCRNGAELDAILNARELTLSGSLNGAPVRFPVGTPAITRFDDRPAFVTPFPASVHYLHRRRHFRASVPAGSGFRCEIPLDDGQLAHLRIADLSVSGVGLRAPQADAPPLLRDARIRRCRLSCADLGTLEVDLEVVRHRVAWRGGKAVHHFGGAFRHVDGQTEKQLQRLVFACELAHRA
ncbi:flagellar brake protein [Cupriavidus basilensis]|uniref:flagellar brake protein n=1 Tax=Cupriavidus basilensis TaxID=68895 RepID=UPI000750FFA1|nr:flagellar brake protein [Cupriavidus basilensis]